MVIYIESNIFWTLRSNTYKTLSLAWYLSTLDESTMEFIKSNVLDAWHVDPS